jgi:ubiquinone biosynthesis protein COQ9
VPAVTVWDTLSPENRMRMVHAVVARVEVDEPNGDIRAFMTNLGVDAEEVARAIEVTP